MSLFVFEAGLQCLDLGGLDEGFIALYVDDDIAVDSRLLVGLKASVCAAFVVFSSHDGLSAKCENGIINALVVGGHEHIVHYTAHLFIDPLDDRLAAQYGQGLGWESCRSVSCWYYCYKLHFNVLYKCLFMHYAL